MCEGGGKIKRERECQRRERTRGGCREREEEHERDMVEMRERYGLRLRWCAVDVWVE